MPMNNRILRPLALPLLLDAVPGAAAAYSLRQLSNSYTGPVVTVRRSSDNAEADFRASEIDDGTLAAFCGAGDGLVKTWHDQSGNNRDASQATAASQPKIVSSGSLVTEGGKATLDFDGTDDRFSANGISYVFDGEDKPYSIFTKAATDSVDNSEVIFSAGRAATNGVTIVYYSLPRLIFFRRDNAAVGTDFIAGITLASGNDILSVTNTGTVDITFLNGAFNRSKTANLGVFTVTKVTIGALDRLTVEAFFSGTISELIIYPSDQSANRQRIEGDLAWYY